MSGRVVDVIDRATFIHHTARCPICGNPVHALTNGAYACESGGRGMRSPHIFYSRHELDGDIEWWHGRLPFTVLMMLAPIFMLIALVKTRLEGRKQE